MLAKYTLDKWDNLPQYGLMNKARNQLKTMNRQFAFYMDEKNAMKNNLISLLGQTFPEVNDLFSSPARPGGSQKWVDFVYTYRHVDCVRSKSPDMSAEHYRNWCSRNDYNFNADKAGYIYETTKNLIAVFPKKPDTKRLIQQAARLLDAKSQTVEPLRIQMNDTASKLPEYPVVMAMNGVGPSLGSQLTAEIGDVTRFVKKSAITAFAGVDPGVNESGSYRQQSVPATKKGSPCLRFHGGETQRRQSLLCLHDCWCQQVSQDLLRTGERIPCFTSTVISFSILLFQTNGNRWSVWDTRNSYIKLF